ncbi:MAG: HlyC/CorC family transporter [Nitrospinota bacterium]|nr:MAG: HlyC/CorC family transporter [Nitrospinota bacterium]
MIAWLGVWGLVLGGVGLYMLCVRAGLAMMSEDGVREGLVRRSSRLRREGGVQPWYLLDTVLLGIHGAFGFGVIAITAFLLSHLPWGAEIGALILSVGIFVLVGEFLPRYLPAPTEEEKGFSIYAMQLLAAACSPLLRIGTALRCRLGKGKLERRSLFSPWSHGAAFLRATSFQEETLTPEERQLMERIGTLGEISVREVMVPLIRIVAVEETATVRETIKKIQEYGYSRLPVYRERIYNIVGVVNAFDLLLLPPDVEEIAGIIRPAYYVPEAKRIDGLLQEMQRNGVQMAVVVDEYGGSVGIITIEDLLEEIVGEIEDEYDTGITLYEELPEGGYLIDARMEINAINEKLHLRLPKGDYETLGGFVIHMFERIPRPGEELTYGQLRLRIEAASDRAVQRIRVQPITTLAREKRLV